MVRREEDIVLKKAPIHSSTVKLVLIIQLMMMNKQLSKVTAMDQRMIQQ